MNGRRTNMRQVPEMFDVHSPRAGTVAGAGRVAKQLDPPVGRARSRSHPISGQRGLHAAHGAEPRARHRGNRGRTAG